LTVPPSLSLALRCIHSNHHSWQGILESTRVYLARLQQDGSGTTDIRADHAAHTTHAAAAPASTSSSANATTSPVPAVVSTTSATATTQLLSTSYTWGELLSTTTRTTKTCPWIWIQCTTQLAIYFFSHANFWATEWVYDWSICRRAGV
jgi:hypothetical protein